MNTSNSAIKGKSYWRRKYFVSIAGTLLTLAVLFIIQFTGFSDSLRDLAFSISSNYYLGIIIYLILFNAIISMVIIPISAYGGYIIEHSYGLSNQNLASWISDEIKGGAVSLVFFLIAIVSLYTLISLFPELWWMASALFLLLFSLFIAKIFPVVILPLFFRYSPIEKEELQNRIMVLAEKFNIKIFDIKQIDYSSKTKKANAAIIGFGSSRKIIMADNLVNEFTTDEAVVVLAHEMAHYKLHHLWKLLFIGSASTILFFFILSRVINPLAGYFEYSTIKDIALFPVIYGLFILYNFIVQPFVNAYSRALEREADIMALDKTGLKDAFVSLMNRLAEKNLSDKNPSRIIELIFYNHPPVSKRIELARNYTI